MQSSESRYPYAEKAASCCGNGRILDVSRLVDEYLPVMNIKVTDCERDSETGSYLFEVHILMDPEGKSLMSL